MMAMADRSRPLYFHPTWPRPTSWQKMPRPTLGNMVMAKMDIADNGHGPYMATSPTDIDGHGRPGSPTQPRPKHFMAMEDKGLHAG